MKFLRYILSLVYHTVIGIRNMLYDSQVLVSHKVDIPTICVGNLAVGGTGKTPHAIYIAQMLSSQYKIAILLRGYGRRSRGFVLADEHSSVATVGDEAMMMYEKMPDIPVAVCKDRIEGIRRLREMFPDLKVVILDDCMQYRRLRPGLTMLLTAADNLYVNDHYLPYGKLRDLRSQSLRAKVVVITKIPDNIRPIELAMLERSLRLPPYQRCFFSYYSYGGVMPVFADYAVPFEQHKRNRVAVLAAIAEPKQMAEYVKAKYTTPDTQYLVLSYPDHHNFVKNDFAQLENMDLVITTEKDAVRLTECGCYPDELKYCTYKLPITIDLKSQKEQFNQIINAYVKDHNRNRGFSAR